MANMFGLRPPIIVVWTGDAAGAVDRAVWVCPANDTKYQLTSVQEVHSTVGGLSAAVRPRKVTDTSAPGAAASGTVLELTAANVDLTATVNVIQTPTLTATESSRYFLPGNRLCLDFSGTVTGLVGCVLVFVLEPVESFA